MTSTLRLYFIADTTDGSNFDLLVWAEDPEKALDHWRAYFEFDDNIPEQLFEVVVTIPRPGPVAWHDPLGAKLIASRR